MKLLSIFAFAIIGAEFCVGALGDEPDLEMVQSLATPALKGVSCVSISADGKLTLVSSQQAGTFVAPGAAGLCISPDGKFLYIADERENALEVFKTR
ncbi:MAG TPA: hypothetical protein VGH90_05160 [Chthoniobacteraceae bacterium]|jgi:sugar lactone lactonase YvrE